KEQLAAHRRIIFNGNGYSDAWVEEAEKRGLPNIKSMVEAIPALTTEASVRMFEEFNVFTKAELESRVEIEYEAYSKAINIEARTMIDMAGKQIIPAAVKYATMLADSLSKVQTACPDADVSVQAELLTETSAYLSDMK
ncbi:glutamine synthetase type III, partial [Anaerotignum faecicola]|nr:glutamine synthetase type III [Anaerotignum faecicola]